MYESYRAHTRTTEDMYNNRLGKDESRHVLPAVVFHNRATRTRTIRITHASKQNSGRPGFIIKSCN